MDKKQEVLEILKADSKGVHISEIQRRLPGTYTTVKVILVELMGEGKVIEKKVGRNSVYSIKDE